MTQLLTQREIDQLLMAINGSDIINTFESIEKFEEFLINRETKTEKIYGLFKNDITVCTFFDGDKNENILEDIKKKNIEQGYGNVKIPNTNIMFINYSFCPKCKTVFSFKDIVEYYKSPKPDLRFKDRSCQYREDTRVYCYNCDTHFIPSLIISDGTPKNEVQLLCRAQTIDAIEKYMLSKNIRVLTRNKDNIILKGNQRAIKNDVYLKDLEEKPTLITNLVQYTPYKYILNLIDGTNVEKGDLLFNEFR